MTEPRPKHTDPRVIAKHMEMVRPSIKKYLEDGDGPIAEDELDRAMKGVRDAMRYDTDGYRIARSLDSDGWEGTEDLVELMSSLAGERHRAYQEIVMDWVETNKIDTQLTIGTRVRIVSGLPPKNLPVEGEIIAITGEIAKFTVFCESLGHVRGGAKGGGTLGCIVGYEDVEPLSELTALAVRIDDMYLTLDLSDGRTVSTPIADYPKLQAATPDGRRDFQLIAGGVGIRWEALDEDLSVRSLAARSELDPK